MTDASLKPTPRLPRRREFIFDCALHGLQPGVTWTDDDHCPVCAAVDAAQRAADEKAARRLIELERLHFALDLPARFCTADLASHPCTTAAQRAAVTACQAFVNSMSNDGAGLVLIGPPGTGKTTLAAAVCRETINVGGRSARLVRQRDLIRTLRATWQKGSARTEDQVLDEFLAAGLLVLDDAGIGYGGDSELVQLLDVVDGRYTRRMPTMVCTNLSAPQLARALGDRIFDRLREDARFVICDWPSHRIGPAGLHLPPG